MIYPKILTFPYFIIWLNILWFSFLFLSGKGLPHFGQYKKQRESAMAEHKKNSDLHSEENMPAKVRPPVEPKKEIATIQVRFIMIFSG